MYWNQEAGLTLAGQALVASLLAGLASGLGGVVVVAVPNLSRKIYDALLGFSAGVMLSAAALGFHRSILPRTPSGRPRALTVCGLGRVD
jgi:zinc transporter ZupT